MRTLRMGSWACEVRNLPSWRIPRSPFHIPHYGVVKLVLVGLIIRASCALAAEAPSEGALSPEASAAAALLDASDVFTRHLGFMRLEALREPASAEVIRKYLDSRDPEMRALSVRALAAVEGPAAVPLLLDKLARDRHPRVRLATVLALEPLEDPQVPAALMSRLRDRDPEVRMAAVDAVSRLDSKEARQAIRQRYRRERQYDVRRVLQQAIKRIEQPPRSP